MKFRAVYLHQNATAFQAIAAVYRHLETASERDAWHTRTLGKEDSFTEIKVAARGCGFVLIPTENVY